MGYLSQLNQDLKDAQTSLFNGNPSQNSSSIAGTLNDIKGISKTVTGTVAGVGQNVAKVSGKLAGVANALGMNGLGKTLGGLAGALNGTTNTQYKEQKYENGLKAFYERMGCHDKSSLAYYMDSMNTFECYFEFSEETELLNIIESQLKSGQKHTPPQIDPASKPSEKNIYEGNCLNLGIFIQSLTLPQLTTNGGETINTLVGDFPLNGSYIKPDTNSFQMQIVNTINPIGENIFYPWMRETTLPKWSYEKQPYTTADITIDLSEHCNIKYKFLNCRPSQIQTYQPTQESSQSFSRLITFIFDYMTVESVMKNVSEYIEESQIIEAVKGIEQAKKSKLDSTLDTISNVGNKVSYVATNILKL